LRYALDFRRHGSRIQSLAAAVKRLVHHTTSKKATAQDKPLRNPVNDHIARINAEIQQGLTTVVVANENGG
jgi:hypothetical protein